MLLSVGCVGNQPTDPCKDEDALSADSGLTFVCDSDFHVEIGTGEISFEPVSMGTLPLVRGSQGAQHVTLALRVDLSADELVVDRAMLRVTPHRVDDGAIVAPLQLGVALMPADGALEVLGVRVVFPEPADVVDREFQLAADLSPVGLERNGHAMLTGTVRWVDSEGPL